MDAAQLMYFYVAFVLTTILCVVFLLLLIKRTRAYKELSTEFEEKTSKLSLRMYESTVLAELSIRFGYSLNLELVLHTVIGSLQKIMPYSVASYLLLDGKTSKYRFHLLESVPRSYIDSLKESMKKEMLSLSVSDISQRAEDEAIFGQFISSDAKEAKTLLNIPLLVSGNVMGILSISSTEKAAFSRGAIDSLENVLSKSTEAVTNLHDLIKHEKGKLEAMVESMTDGVLMIDSEFRVLLSNPACTTLLGITKKSNSAVLDKILNSTQGMKINGAKGFSINIFDVVSSLNTQFPVEETLAEVFEKQETRSVSNITVNDKHLNVVIIPVTLGDDQRGVGILIHDQSKEWKLKKLREEFTAMIVHELRSPLTVVLGTADLLEKQYERLSKEQIELLLGQVKTSVSSLLAIVNDLLDAAKIEAGKFEVFKDSEHNLNDLITEEASYYSNLASEKGLTIELHSDKKLKPFKFDEDKIKQVMNNLISNAIKFTEHGNITIATKVLHAHVQVTVADTGLGITDEEKEKLFNKFVQVSQSKHKGTGLGLVVSKGIIEGHGGKIWVEDNFPSGAKFVFTLPLD
ncbi:MAG: ATP-binding protein [Patescibacteria group bacterium]